MNLLEHLRRCRQPAPAPKNSNFTTRLPALQRHSPMRDTFGKRSGIKSSPSPKSFSKQARWESLPPIYELKRPKILDLQPRQSEVIENLLLSKNEASAVRSRSHRNKTEMATYKKRYMLSHRSSVSINFEENRMKPIDKYYKRLDNIRMAERLLTVKPSPGLKRDTLKKFYLQQRNYRSQISKNMELTKAKVVKGSSRVVKEWFF